MTKEEQAFEDYKLVHYFIYPNEPLKQWINEKTYINLYETDWNEIIKIANKIIWELGEKYELSDEVEDIATSLSLCNKYIMYEKFIKFIKFYNEKEGL